MGKIRKKRGRSSAKWIGSSICMGICIWITHVHGLEMGGFEVEVQTGESTYPSQWWEDGEESLKPESDPEPEPEPEPDSRPESELKPEPELKQEQNPEQISEPNREISHTQMQQNQSENSQKENKQKEVREQKRKEEPIETNRVPDISKVPEKTEKKQAHKKIKQNFTVDFVHPEIPECIQKPGIFVKSEGQVGILSVRHNGQECLWYWDGDELLWEVDPCKGENRIEILAVTEDCRLIRMEPWIYKT